MTVNKSPSISTSHQTGQSPVHGMGLSKYAFKHAGVGGKSVSQHAAVHAQSGGRNTIHQKQLVPLQNLLDKRGEALEKKADGYRTKVQKILLSEDPSSLVNVFKLNYNLRKMEKTGLNWNYTATKDFGDSGAVQAKLLLQGLERVKAVRGVTTPNATDALCKLENELEAASRKDADIEAEDLQEAQTEMLEAQDVLAGAAPGTAAHTDAQNALDRATRRHAAAQKRIDEPGRHATHSNMERATEAGEKLVKELSDMRGKDPAQQKESLDQLTKLMELAERADGFNGAMDLFGDDKSELQDHVGHLLDLQVTGDNSKRVAAELQAAFLYGVVAAAGDRHNAATGTDVAKVFTKLSTKTGNSVLGKLAEWKEPSVSVNAGGTAATQPVRMNEAAGAYRDQLAQVAKDDVKSWTTNPTVVFGSVAQAMATLKKVPPADWGDAKLAHTLANRTPDLVDFSKFQVRLDALNITDPANSKALRTHMAAQWVKSAIDEMNAYDAAHPGPGNYLNYLNATDRAFLQSQADQAMAQVAPIATAASQAAAKAKTEALKLELGSLADTNGHGWLDANAFKQVAGTLSVLANRNHDQLGSTTFAPVNGATWGNGNPFQFDFNAMFGPMIIAKGINPTSNEAVELKNYLAARWIRSVLDAMDTAEAAGNDFNNELDMPTRATLRMLADKAAPRPVADPKPGVPPDWANRLAAVALATRGMLTPFLPDQPANPPTAQDLTGRVQAFVNGLLAVSGTAKGKLDAAQVPLFQSIINANCPPSNDPALVAAMKADIIATMTKTLLEELEIRQRRQAVPGNAVPGYDVSAVLEGTLDAAALSKLRALTFEPNLQPESAWTFKLADTRKSARDFMTRLDTDSKTNVNKAKQTLEFMVTMLNQVADKGMPWPLPTRFGFDKIIDDLVPVEAPFDQVESMSKDLAMVWVQELAKEIEDRERNLVNTSLPYFGTGAHRSAKLKQEARDEIASRKPGQDLTAHMYGKRTYPGWSGTQLANAKTDASLHWNQLKIKPDATARATKLSADLERLSTVKRADLAAAMEEIKAFKGIVDNCLPSPLPVDNNLVARMRNDLAAAFLRELAIEIEADIGMRGLMRNNRRPGMLDDLMKLPADTSLL